MRSKEEFVQFYNTTLSHQLGLLEQERKQYFKNIVKSDILLIFALITPVLFFALIFHKILYELIVPLLLIFIIARSFIGKQRYKNYVKFFKTNIIECIVNFLDSNLTYFPNQKIAESDFKASKIFKDYHNRYYGDDLVTGHIGNTDIQFSEIEAFYHAKQLNDLVFKGLFFIGDFHKEFLGETFILPDLSEKHIGYLSQVFQSLNKYHGQLVKLEDPEFERQFAVYSSDQIESRYILSTSLIKRITDFQRKANKKILLSFVGSKIFMAVPYDKNLFEPRVNKTLLDYNTIERYFEDLQLMIGIVEDLNLNTRIWDKKPSTNYQREQNHEDVG
jgi:uncharacterized protein DUF3137